MPVKLDNTLALIKTRIRMLVALPAVLAALVFVLALLGPLRIYTNKGTETSPVEFAQARNRWDTRTFSKYRLVLSYWSTRYGLGGDGCRQEVEVQDERVVSVLSRTCESERMLTVTDIFDLFEPFVGTDPIQRSPSGSTGYFVVDAVYDEQYGYPAHMESREFHGIPERGQYLTYGSSVWVQMSPPLYRVIVESLQPMP